MFAKVKDFIKGTLTKLDIPITIVMGQGVIIANFIGVVAVDVPRGNKVSDGVWRIPIIAMLVDFADKDLKLLCMKDLRALALGVQGKAGGNPFMPSESELNTPHEGTWLEALGSHSRYATLSFCALILLIERPKLARDTC